MRSYAFAIGNVRMYLRIGPKTRTTRRTKAKKEDVSGETRTYDNPTPAHTPISLLPSKFKTAAEAVCKHTLNKRTHTGQKGRVLGLVKTPHVFTCSKLEHRLRISYFPKSQITTRLQPTQNSLARAVVKTPKSSRITPILRSLHWLKISTSFFSLTVKIRL